MTIRALLIGTTIALLIAGFGYINDGVMRLTSLVGNHLPISVFGLLILMVIGLNPLLGLVRPSWRLLPGELALMTGLMLVACSIPGSGLMRTFTTTMAMPFEHNKVSPGWRKTEVLSYAPREMLIPRVEEVGPDGRLRIEGDPVVQENYLTGFKNQNREFPLTEVFSDKIPWSHWAQPLRTWLPLVLLMSAAVIALALIVHPQWAWRERLRYPIADFASSLLEGSSESGRSSIIGNRVFWLGLAVVLVIRVVNGIHAWFPSSLEIPLMFDFSAISGRFTGLMKAPGWWWLVHPRLLPAVVAFAFFLGTDVSFSLGISQMVAIPLLAALLTAGVDVKSDYMTGGAGSWQKFGSFLGIGLLLLYVGRRYYWQILKEAVTFRVQQGVERYGAWACRILLVAVAALVVLLGRLGLDWPFALLTVLLILLMFVVIARVNAESGLFFIQPSWQPLGILVGLFGFGALGPKALVIVGLICAVLSIDPRECLMPFMVNALRIGEQNKLRPSRFGWSAAAIFVLGLAVAVPVVLWSNYYHGIPREDNYATVAVPKMPFVAGAGAITTLTQSGDLKKSVGLSTVERIEGLWSSHPQKQKFLVAAGIGLGLVFLFSVLRLRFTWWPLHPVMFLVWDSYPLWALSHSFLLGWAIKAAVTKFGGTQAYRSTRVLMVGAIAGDLLGGLIFMIIGWIYYSVTGVRPKPYNIFPV